MKVRNMKLFLAIAVFLTPALALAQSAGTVNLPTGVGVITPGSLSATINTAMQQKLDSSGLGQPNGAAALDSTGGLIPTNFLRSRTNLGLVNPQQLPHWRAALAAMMNTTTAPFVHPRIMMMIDSTTMGENASGTFFPKNISYWLAQDLVNAGIPANNNSVCGGSVGERKSADYRCAWQQAIH